MTSFTSRMPRHPAGDYAGRGSGGDLGMLGLRVGIITRVDELSMKADVKIITGMDDRFEVDLTQAMAGPRSFWGGVPEVNSLVVIGYRPKGGGHALTEAVILGYYPVGNRSGLCFDPFSSVDPSLITADDAATAADTFSSLTRYKRLRLRPGDVGGMSSSGAELTLSKDVRMVNRAGDLLELRDAERTLVMQATHSIQSESGVRRFSGPARRGALWLPSDIFAPMAKDGTRTTLLTENDRYFGRDDLQAMGPGATGSVTKFVDSNGKTRVDIINDATNFPPVMYTNGKRVFYPATTQAVNFEMGEKAAGAEAYTEHRLEMAETTRGYQDVLSEIDGFNIGIAAPFIEQVIGTTVGNDSTSTEGLRKYGRILRPHLFQDWDQKEPAKFTMEAIEQSPVASNELQTAAGAFLFRVSCPLGTQQDPAFSCAVSKQGKLYLRALGEKQVSAEINLDGALKMFIGQEGAGRTSLNLTTQGGIEATLGKDLQGRSINVTFAGSVRATYAGNPDEDDLAKGETIGGNSERVVQGDDTQSVKGSQYLLCNGMVQYNVDRFSVNANTGVSYNTSEWSSTIAGKSIYNYALAVIENIVAGGRITTVLAGGAITTVLAGVYSITAAAGAMSLTAGAGAISATAGAAMTMNAGAAFSVSAGAAVSMTAGAALSMTAALAVSVTSSVIISLTAPMIQLGGAPAVLGVVRGVPSMGPGSPSLDFITGLPLFGSAVVTSL